MTTNSNNSDDFVPMEEDDEDDGANPEMVARITGAKEILKPKISSKYRGGFNFIEDGGEDMS